MKYKWKPSKTQAREFVDKMNNDANFAQSYKDRKEAKTEKRREGSIFNYGSAGGYYIPTQNQWEFAMNNRHLFTTHEQEEAANRVTYGFSCQEKVHHDYIHIINELIRENYEN